MGPARLLFAAMGLRPKSLLGRFAYLALSTNGSVWTAWVAVRLVADHVVGEAIVAVGGVAGAGVIVWLRFSERGRKLSRTNFADDWVGTLATAVAFVAAATAGFSALSELLYTAGAWSFPRAPQLHGLRLGTATFAYFVWHLADAIPGFKVPDTLNWKLARPFTDTWNGALALLYQASVVAPALYGASQIAKRRVADVKSQTVVVVALGRREEEPEKLAGSKGSGPPGT